MAFAVFTARAWPRSSVDHGPAHLNSPASTYYQARSVMTCTLHGGATLGQGTFGTWYMLPSTSMADFTGLRHAEFPVPLIMLLTDMVSRCRLLAAHGLRSCLSVRTQPLTATGVPSQTSAMPCHAMQLNLSLSDDNLHGAVRGS